MKIIENKLGFTTISPESDDYIIYSLERNTYHKKVVLGKNDSVDNYKQIKKSLIEEADDKAQADILLKRIEEQDAIISKLSKQISDLIDLVNKNK